MQQNDAYSLEVKVIKSFMKSCAGTAEPFDGKRGYD